MTDDERDKIERDAMHKANTESRIAALEGKMKVMLTAAYGVVAWVAIKIAEVFASGGGPK